MKGVALGGLLARDSGGGERMVSSARVDALVRGHAALPLELLAAVRALVRLLAGVQTHVSLEIGLARESLLAAVDRTGVDFDGSRGDLWGAWGRRGGHDDRGRRETEGRRQTERGTGGGGRREKEGGGQKGRGTERARGGIGGGGGRACVVVVDGEIILRYFLRQQDSGGRTFAMREASHSLTLKRGARRHRWHTGKRPVEHGGPASIERKTGSSKPRPGLKTRAHVLGTCYKNFGQVASAAAASRWRHRNRPIQPLQVHYV